MAKTMNEYYKELLESIPTPETLQQMKLAENVEQALEELTRCGRYYFTCCNTGSRESEISMKHKVVNVFAKKKVIIPTGMSIPREIDTIFSGLKSQCKLNKEKA